MMLPHTLVFALKLQPLLTNNQVYIINIFFFAVNVLVNVYDFKHLQCDTFGVTITFGGWRNQKA